MCERTNRVFLFAGQRQAHCRPGGRRARAPWAALARGGEANAAAAAVPRVRCQPARRERGRRHGGGVYGVRVPGSGRDGADGRVGGVSGRVPGPARGGLGAGGRQCRRGGGDGRVSLGDERPGVCQWGFDPNRKQPPHKRHTSAWQFLLRRRVVPIRQQLQTFRMQPPPPPVRGRHVGRLPRMGPVRDARRGLHGKVQSVRGRDLHAAMRLLHCGQVLRGRWCNLMLQL